MPRYFRRMRLALAFCLLATTAQAWEFTPLPVCTLTSETREGSVTVTWDPRRTEPYAIAVTRPTPWPAGPVFSIRYDGGRVLTISTSRHVVSDGGKTLTVTDRGFGNVLDGIEFNTTATAVIGSAEVSFPLDGAAGPVQEFRACTSAAVATLVPRRNGSAMSLSARL